MYALRYTEYHPVCVYVAEYRSEIIHSEHLVYATCPCVTQEWNIHDNWLQNAISRYLVTNEALMSPTQYFY